MASSLDRLLQRMNAESARAVRASDAEGVRAAVAVVVREREGRDEILFIKRAEREGDPWSGHMAFPGGRWQASDTSLLYTAMRETREEVGLDLEKSGRVVARLPDVMPYSRMPHALTVTAFTFAVDEPVELTLNDEVAAVVWAPLDVVLRGDTATSFRWNRDGVDLTLPALDVDGNVVWGLTYRMLELLREAIA